MGLVLAGGYAAVNVVTIGPGTWPHNDGSLFNFFFHTGFLAVFVVLSLYYAIAYSLRYRFHIGCIMSAYGMLLAAEAFTFWVLLRASADV